MAEKTRLFENLRGIAAFVVSIGVGSIVLSAVDHVTPGNMKIASKIFRTAGAAALSGMIADKCADYTDEKISEFENSISVEKGELEEETDES